MKPIAVMFLCAVAIGLGTSATPRPPDSLKLTGYAGALGEWELAAAITQAGGQELSGPLNLKHVGYCRQDGPEEKTGAVRLRLAGPSSAVVASLMIDGVTCTYSGRLSSLHTGLMACPGKRAVPITLWAD